MLETVSIVRVCKVRIFLLIFIVKTEVEITSWVKPQLGSRKTLIKILLAMWAIKS